MTTTIGIIMANANVKLHKIINFLNEVYDEYKGKLFETVKVTWGETISLEDKKFNELKSIITKNPTNLTFSFKNFQGDLWIEYEPHRVSINFEASGFHYHCCETEEAQKNFDELIDFAKIVMKHSYATYFFAARNSYVDRIEKCADLQLLYCPEDQYYELISEYIKRNFGVELDDKTIIEITEKAAIKIEKQSGWILINFMRDCTHQPTKIAETVKKYLAKRKEVEPK